MIHSPCVSVIIPVYNAEKYISCCLNSLVNQSLSNIELIIINDGSTDGSLAICNEYAKRDGRIIIYSQLNKGLAAARRVGMMLAKGQYIGFVDSDDWVELNMFEVMYNTGINKCCDIVFCNCFKERGNKQVRGGQQIRNGYYNRQQIIEEILPRTLAGLNDKGNSHVIRWSNCLRIYKRSMLVEKKIFHDERFRRCQDLQLTFEATLNANSYYYLGDEYLYHNRETIGSLSRGYTKNMWKYLQILIKRLYEDVDMYPEYSLRRQMDLCTFFFAISCCQNESKKNNGISNTEREDNVFEVCNNDFVQDSLVGIPVEKLSDTNKLYYTAIKKKDIKGILYINKKKQREELYRNIISSLLRNKAIKLIYLALRHRN